MIIFHSVEKDNTKIRLMYLGLKGNNKQLTTVHVLCGIAHACACST